MLRGWGEEEEPVKDTKKSQSMKLEEKKGEYDILEANERSCSESDRLGQMRLID